MSACPACGHDFESPDTDPFCSSCVEAGARDSYLRGHAAGVAAERAKALAEACELSYSLGTAHGVLLKMLLRRQE